MAGFDFQKEPGFEHHLTRALREAQEKFLHLLSEGVSPVDAIAMVDRKRDQIKVWRRDPKFKDRMDVARSKGGKAIETVLGKKLSIKFEEFSEEFLGSPLFPHHLSWIDFLEGREPSWLHDSMVFERGTRSKRLLLNVPPEHGKSTVITVNYALYRICMNPNIKIIIVSKTQERAKEYLYSIKQRLSNERWAKLQAVYAPSGGWKEDSDMWRSDRIYLSRDSSEKDPTVQALGIGGQITGSRADLIILDDVVTTSNAHEWGKQLNWIQKDVVTRLGDTGTLLVVGTRIAPNDLYRELRNNEHWVGGQTPFTYLSMPAVLEFDDDPEKWVTLWAKSHIPWEGADDPVPDESGLYPKWDGPALFRRRSEVNAASWALVYQQQDVQEDSIFAPACVQGSVNGMRKRGPLKPGVPGHPKELGAMYTIMGLDPAMAGKTAAVMMTVNRHTGQRYILDVANMPDPTPQKVQQLIEDWVTLYQPQEIRIEINAHQKHYQLDSDLRDYLANRGVRFSSQFTGKNKWDTSFGVAAMSQLFGTIRNSVFQKDNLLELPSQDGSEGIKALIQQLITWKPDTKGPTDCVMALWFCELRAKEVITGMMSKQAHMNNRWATQAQRDKRYQMNLSDYEESLYM